MGLVVASHPANQVNHFFRIPGPKAHIMDKLCRITLTGLQKFIDGQGPEIGCFKRKDPKTLIDDQVLK